MLFHVLPPVRLLFHVLTPSIPSPSPSPSPNPYPIVFKGRGFLRITLPKKDNVVNGFKEDFPYIHFWFSQKGISFWDCYGDSRITKLVERKVTKESVQFFVDSLPQIPLSDERKNKLIYQLALSLDRQCLNTLANANLPPSFTDHILYLQNMRGESNPIKRLELIRQRNKTAPIQPTRTYRAKLDTEFQAKGLMLDLLREDIQASIDLDDTTVVKIRPLRDERSVTRQIVKQHNAVSYKTDS